MRMSIRVIPPLVQGCVCVCECLCLCLHVHVDVDVDVCVSLCVLSSQAGLDEKGRRM